MAINDIRFRPSVPSTNNRTEDTPRTTRTGNSKQFQLRAAGEKQKAVDPKKSEQERQQLSQSDQNWLKKRTTEELRTTIQAIQEGITDPWTLTDIIFYARHPEMKGVPLTNEYQDLLDEWNSISAYIVHPTLNEISDFLGSNISGGKLPDGVSNIGDAIKSAGNFNINVGSLDRYTTRFDDIIVSAVEQCPGLSPAILKSLLAQESRFNPTVINSYGYAGIAQFGREAAREVGLYVGVAGTASDERLNPTKAIPGAARLLSIKAQRLSEMAFSRYGQPDGINFWKFVTAAYNGGEGTVALAMGHAYRLGLETARGKGLVGPEAVSFARRYASDWENLKIGGMGSPLGLAAARYFPKIAESKYREIGNYPTHIVARAEGKMA